MAICGENGKCCVLRISDYKQVQNIIQKGCLNVVRFSTDDKYLAIAGTKVSI